MFGSNNEKKETKSVRFTQKELSSISFIGKIIENSMKVKESTIFSRLLSMTTKKVYERLFSEKTEIMKFIINDEAGGRDYNILLQAIADNYQKPYDDKFKVTLLRSLQSVLTVDDLVELTIGKMDLDKINVDINKEYKSKNTGVPLGSKIHPFADGVIDQEMVYIKKRYFEENVLIQGDSGSGKSVLLKMLIDNHVKENSTGVFMGMDNPVRGEGFVHINKDNLINLSKSLNIVEAQSLIGKISEVLALSIKEKNGIPVFPDDFEKEEEKEEYQRYLGIFTNLVTLSRESEYINEGYSANIDFFELFDEGVSMNIEFAELGFYTEFTSTLLSIASDRCVKLKRFPYPVFIENFHFRNIEEVDSLLYSLNSAKINLICSLQTQSFDIGPAFDTHILCGVKSIARTKSYKKEFFCEELNGFSEYESVVSNYSAAISKDGEVEYFNHIL